jgi:hypothetical protein
MKMDYMKYLLKWYVVCLLPMAGTVSSAQSDTRVGHASAPEIVNPGQAGSQAGPLGDALSAARPDRASKLWDHGRLQVGENHQYVEHADGTPFLWIGDTAWQLFYRLKSRDAGGNDLEKYFGNRVERGFTVIQAVLIDELDYKSGKGCTENGSMPFVDRDPTRRVDGYWQWVDFVISRAEHHGIYLCLLPCWGNWVNDEAIFDSLSAYDYGRFLGERYADSPNIIWMLGGDREVNAGQKIIWNSMAKGIKDQTGNRHLITFHPRGAKSSSEVFHSETWLDFNTYQSGHAVDEPNVWQLAVRDVQRTPAKPTLNSEPGYEGIVARFWESCDNAVLTDYDVRKDAYRSLFSGTWGHTYGHSSIWQMLRPGDKPAACADSGVPWYHAIEWEGAAQMIHVARLLRSRPAHRWTDESLVAEGLGSGSTRMGASRGEKYALIYFPASMTRSIATDRISGDRVTCYWFNPRNGVSTLIGTFAKSGEHRFTTPDNLDWVFVIDDAGAGFNSPGTDDLWYLQP